MIEKKDDKVRTTLLAILIFRGVYKCVSSSDPPPADLSSYTPSSAHVPSDRLHGGSTVRALLVDRFEDKVGNDSR